MRARETVFAYPGTHISRVIRLGMDRHEILHDSGSEIGPEVRGANSHITADKVRLISEWMGRVRRQDYTGLYSNDSVRRLFGRNIQVQDFIYLHGCKLYVMNIYQGVTRVGFQLM